MSIRTNIPAYTFCRLPFSNPLFVRSVDWPSLPRKCICFCMYVCESWVVLHVVFRLRIHTRIHFVWVYVCVWVSSIRCLHTDLICTSLCWSLAVGLCLFYCFNTAYMLNEQTYGWTDGRTNTFFHCSFARILEFQLKINHTYIAQGPQSRKIKPPDNWKGFVRNYDNNGTIIY